MLLLLVVLFSCKRHVEQRLDDPEAIVQSGLQLWIAFADAQAVGRSSLDTKIDPQKNAFGEIEGIVVDYTSFDSQAENSGRSAENTKETLEKERCRRLLLLDL